MKIYSLQETCIFEWLLSSPRRLSSSFGFNSPGNPNPRKNGDQNTVHILTKYPYFVHSWLNIWLKWVRTIKYLSARQVFGNAAFRQEQATASPPPTSPQSSQIPPPTSSFGGNRYRTELVYDPQSGQYTSVQVQANPHTNEEFELTQKLRAYSVNPSPSPSPVTYTSAPTFSTPTGAGAYTQIQQFGQPQIQYYHQSEPPQGRSVNSPHPQPQDPSQINQFLARHAYQQQEQQQQTQTSNLQFIPPHLRPGAHQTAEIQRQEVRELNFPSPSSNLQSGLSANSAAASNGQIDAFLRALNISI